MAQAQADADVGMASLIAQATAGKAGAAADHSAALAEAARRLSSSTWATRAAVHVAAGPS